MNYIISFEALNLDAGAIVSIDATVSIDAVVSVDAVLSTDSVDSTDILVYTDVLLSTDAVVSIDAIVSIDAMVSIDATNNCCQSSLAQAFLSVSTLYSSFQASACYLGQRILRNEED